MAKVDTAPFSGKIFEAEEAFKFLAEAGELLASSLDYETTLLSVARLAVPRFCDWCIVDLVTPSRELRRIAIEHADPKKAKFVKMLAERFIPTLDSPSLSIKALASGKTQFAYEMSDDLLKLISRNDEHFFLLKQLGLRSTLSVPLIARGRTHGALTFSMGESQRHYTGVDVSLAEALASRCALAIDNASLYQEAERERRTSAESFASVLTFVRSSPVGLAHIYPDLRFFHVNPAFADMLGVPEDALLERPMTDFESSIIEHLRLACSSVVTDRETIKDVEIEGELPSGEHRYWVVTVSPIALSGSDELLGAGVVARDATRRKLMQGDLERYSRDLSMANSELQTLRERV